MESLVATVVIIIIFTVSTIILNTIFSNLHKTDTKYIDNYIKETEYKIYSKKNINLPIVESIGNWEIKISKSDSLGIEYLMIECLNTVTQKEIKKIKVLNE